MSTHVTRVLVYTVTAWLLGQLSVTWRRLGVADMAVVALAADALTAVVGCVDWP